MYNKFHHASLFERGFQLFRSFFDGTGTAAGGVFPILSFIITLALGAGSILTGPFALLSIGGAYGLFFLIAGTWGLASLKNSNKDLKTLLEKMQRSDEEIQKNIAELFWLYLEYLYLRNNLLYSISEKTLDEVSDIHLSLNEGDYNLGPSFSPHLQNIFNMLFDQFNRKKLDEREKHFVINRETILAFVKEAFQKETTLAPEYDNYRREVFSRPLTKKLPILSSAYRGSLIISGCSIGPLAGALGVIAMFAGISVLSAIPIVGWGLLGGALALTLIVGTIGFSYYMYKNQKRKDYIDYNKSTSANLINEKDTLEKKIEKIKNGNDYQNKYNPIINELRAENEKLRSELNIKKQQDREENKIKLKSHTFKNHLPEISSNNHSCKFFHHQFAKLLVTNSLDFDSDNRTRRCAASAS